MPKINYYSQELPALDIAKPIGCKLTSTGKVSLLIPEIKATGPDEAEGYDIVGFNWFDPTTGEYLSCYCWETLDEALKARSEKYGYELFNVEVSINKLDV